MDWPGARCAVERAPAGEGGLCSWATTWWCAEATRERFTGPLLLTIPVIKCAKIITTQQQQQVQSESFCCLMGFGG